MRNPAATKLGYRLLDHTADMGIVFFGPTVKALYEAAAKALADLLVEGPAPEKAQRLSLDIEGEDRADLMVNWLREILYLWAAKSLWLLAANVEHITLKRLSATVRVAPYDPTHQRIKTDIKAVTYHRIQVRRTKAGWEATVIFDV
ncbi:MAG: archease [Deltaproteobacteria bacterium]|nr:archease [Deltaproteobacteria bacterium]MBW2040516.1 archease [Deltaproteobacteria bacterium]MBW2131384.1 archease [Deltaproteobacteria bacterium]